jgi:UDP-N-acetylmuramoylalanine-D-glutamate ligase
MDIGFVGLGKMGLNMVTRLQRAGHQVTAYDRSADALANATAAGCIGAASLADLVQRKRQTDCSDTTSADPAHARSRPPRRLRRLCRRARREGKRLR